MSDLLRLVPLEHKLRHEWWAVILRASIARQIKELRLSRDWTQDEFAEHLETKQSVISILENPLHKKFPSVRMLRRIAEVFNVALVIRFEGWREGLAFIADAVMPISFNEEFPS